MNNRERTMAIFRRERPDRLLWQPRLHHWYEVNKARGTLPKKYEGYDILGIYDDLDASPRSYHYFNDTIKVIEGDEVKRQVKEDESAIYTKYETPEGNITQVERKTLYGTNSMRVEYFAKGVEDFRILAYVLRRQSFVFDKDLYERVEGLLGDRCEPIVTAPWGSIQRLFISTWDWPGGW